MYIILVLVLLLVVAPAIIILPLYFLIRGTRNKTPMGINLNALACPKCGAPAPRIRKPANLRQALFGGWTCATCHAESDKWGRPLSEK